ncbi:MAG: hypothetical protein AAF471_06340 [Myxococcota bacterium]
MSSRDHKRRDAMNRVSTPAEHSEMDSCPCSGIGVTTFRGFSKRSAGCFSEEKLAERAKMDSRWSLLPRRREPTNDKVESTNDTLPCHPCESRGPQAGESVNSEENRTLLLSFPRKRESIEKMPKRRFDGFLEALFRKNDRARRRNHAATLVQCVNLVFAALLAFGITGCVCAPSSRAVAVHEVVIDLALVSRETSGQLTQDALRPFILSGLRGSGHIRTVAKQQPKSRIARVRLRPVPSQSLKQQRSEAKAGPGDVKLSLFLPPKGAADKRKEEAAPGGDEQECCWGHAIIPAQQFDAHVGKSVRKAVIAAMSQVAKKQRDQPTSTRALVERLRRYQRGEVVPRQQLRQTLHMLRQRKEKQVSPLIRQLLRKEDNTQLARLFLQALAELGEPAGIEAIIAYGHRSQGKENDVGLLDAVAAAGQLGGVEAAGWLFALSTGHSQSSVRDAAAAALVKVEESL